MGINWFWRRRPSKKSENREPQVRSCSLEPLEGRQLLAAVTAISAIADNRGFVQIRFNKTLQTSTVNSTSVRVFTAGPDGTIGTDDDTQVDSTLIYSGTKKLLTINGHVGADQGYRIKLYGSRIKDTDGLKLDGEFKAGGGSGNGVQGGDYQFRVKRDVGATPIARMTSNMGDIDVRLYRGASSFSNVATPLNVANFLKYVNGGDWDNLSINRLENGFVAQMGSYNLTSNGSLNDVPSQTVSGQLLGEPGNTNAIGTLAFALSNGPDTATQDFFFNLGNNNTDSAPNNLDESPGGGPFTVFAKVTNSKGLAILAQISALKRLNLQSLRPNPGDTTLQKIAVQKSVPVEGDTVFSGGSTTKQLDTFKDLVVFTHIGVLSKLVAIS